MRRTKLVSCIYSSGGMSMDVSDKPTVSLTRDKQLVSCIYTSGVMTTMSTEVSDKPTVSLTRLDKLNEVSTSCIGVLLAAVGDSPDGVLRRVSVTRCIVCNGISCWPVGGFTWLCTQAGSCDPHTDWPCCTLAGHC